MIKIGRRGSLNAHITVHGTQGHVAYPDLADNPVPQLLSLLMTLNNHIFDMGTQLFPPTNLEITSIDVGNTTTNLIPAEASAQLNIRFNDQHTGTSLTNFLEARRRELTRRNCEIKMAVSVSGEAFLTLPGDFSDLVSSSVRDITGITPELSTTGGTSDARFIKDHCPVVEQSLIHI